MKIKRNIHGEEIEIELTHEEMVRAAEAVREYDYRNFIQIQVDSLDDDDDRAILKQMDENAREEAIDSMLCHFQLLVEDRDYDWADAWESVSDYYSSYTPQT